jgi:hypothetical protein
MMASRKPGPRALPGPRYDCGRRKPTGDPRGGQTWQFLKQHGERLGADPRLRTQIGRLAFEGQLTDTQVEAAFLCARVYGEFERFKRRRRSAASPSYLRSFGDPDGEEDPQNHAAHPLLLPDGRPRGLTVLERRCARAQERWDKLQDCFAAVPPLAARRVREAIERVAVEDLAIATAELELVAPMLDYIAQRFGIAAAPATTTGIAIRGRSPARRPNPRAADRRTELDKGAWVVCTRMMAQRDGVELDDEELECRWREFQGLKMAVHARARFRGEKERKR